MNKIVGYDLGLFRVIWGQMGVIVTKKAQLRVGEGLLRLQRQGGYAGSVGAHLHSMRHSWGQWHSVEISGSKLGVVGGSVVLHGGQQSSVGVHRGSVGVSGAQRGSLELSESKWRSVEVSVQCIYTQSYALHFR